MMPDKTSEGGAVSEIVRDNPHNKVVRIENCDP